MKINYASDLHIEFGRPNIAYDFGSGDVLVLAGDITVGERLHPRFHDAQSRKLQARFRKLVEHTTKSYKHVLYVFGNHEYYHGIYNNVRSTVKDVLNSLEAHNWRILEDDLLNINGVTFIGSTLWTNFNNNSPTVTHFAESGMMDYRCIYQKDPIELKYTERHGHRPIHRQACITTDFIYNIHQASLNFISTSVIKCNGPKVVITHHPIISKALNQTHSGNLLDYAYYSDYGNWLADQKDIVYWISGHTHQPMEYKVGDTLCLSNPQGYPMEKTFKNFKIKTVEI